RPSSDEAEASLWAQEEGMLAAANRTEQAVGLDDSSFEALESDAHFDHVLFDAQQFGLHAAVGSEEEQDYLGLPGLLEPDQVTRLLHERQSRQTMAATSRGGAPAPAPGPSPVSAHRALASLRTALNKLVAAYSSKTGTPHASIHMDLRRACGGPELAAAASEQVTERIDRIRLWFVGRRR
ncbi:MAG TPA: ATP-dependent helicase, partial [Ornithinibacter sp.]|nr:ATP-dependent helicase [Ornithinibacter sp.]